MTTISNDSASTTAPAPATAAEVTAAAAPAPAAVKATPAKPAAKPAKAAVKPVAAAVAAVVAAPAKKAAPAKRGSAVKAKAAAAPAPAPVAEKAAKAKKPKMVRDSFTIPKDEYAVIESLKQRSGKLSQTAKKSELLRAGLKLLSGLSDAALLQALQAVPSIKTGRPKADDKAAIEAAPAAKRAKAARK